MRFVPTKSIEQQDIQALHRVRTRRVAERTALGNQIRGLLLEFGIAIGLGMVVALVLGARFIEPLLEEQPVAMRALFLGLVLAGAYVPAHMVLRTAPGRWRASEMLIVVAVASANQFAPSLDRSTVSTPEPHEVPVASAVWIVTALPPPA